MSKKPRTPRYWPRMKVRGRRRRQRQGMVKSFKHEVKKFIEAYERYTSFPQRAYIRVDNNFVPLDYISKDGMPIGDEQ